MNWPSWTLSSQFYQGLSSDWATNGCLDSPCPYRYEQYIFFFCAHKLKNQTFCTTYLWSALCNWEVIILPLASFINANQTKSRFWLPIPSLCDPSTFLMGRPSQLQPSPHFLFACSLSSSIQLSWHPAVPHREFLVNKLFYITIDCFSQLSVTGADTDIS